MQDNIRFSGAPWATVPKLSELLGASARIALSNARVAASASIASNCTSISSFLSSLLGVAAVSARSSNCKNSYESERHKYLLHGSKKFLLNNIVLKTPQK